MPIPATAQPVGRPVTHAEPAPYETGYRLTRDRRPHPDYGCVFWTDSTDYQGPKYRYDYSRDGWRFCLSGLGHVVQQGWLNLSGRAFHIAGPSNRQQAA
ncbi:hypothetical protein QO010_000357 [Caulobacter ginsengisoli]|uniref:Beta/gamma crystallin 'Greek key' domain-containing protein n=1 Tax=Caulobacter ginsengisoli TaxID=400775 RepID=A0ABU0IKS0_9CAUL|nr:hypothetical protein [Caulobacter ginsengisoli]MDQ0462609.1 hypothetical protein [Caulobacter ginsengisoli]